MPEGTEPGVGFDGLTFLIDFPLYCSQLQFAAVAGKMNHGG